MTPAERVRWLRVAQAWLSTIPALYGTDGAAIVSSALDAEIQRMRSRVVFRRLDGARWQIHREGETPAEFACELVGLAAAWAAIDAGRSRHVDVREFVASGTRQADGVVRTAIRKTAAQWVERHACAELASALRCISVAGGKIVYRPPISAPGIITR